MILDSGRQVRCQAPDGSVWGTQRLQIGTSFETPPVLFGTWPVMAR
jgi:hypothetical protein